MPSSSTARSLLLPCRVDQVDDFLSQPSAAVIASVTGLGSTVLVLGAGGKMGLHLSLMLRKAADAAGRRLRIVAVSRFRALRERDAFNVSGIETVACDLSDPRQVRDLPDASTIFFLAGVKFGTASSPELLTQMNVVMPRLVAERFRGSRIVAFSTGCVYPFVNVDSRGAAESMPIAPVGAYAESCARREEAFAEVARVHHTPVTLIRLNYAIEFRYGVLVDIATKVFRHEPIDVTMGHVNIIWQTDALAHVIQSVAIAASPAVPLNITGADVVSVRDLARRLGELLGVEPIFHGTEAATAWLNDASLSHRWFGAPTTSLGTMISWTAAWLQSGGQTWGKPTGFEKRDGQF